MSKAISQAVLSLSFASLGFAYWALVLSELSAGIIMLLLLQSHLRLRVVWPRWDVLGSWFVFGRDLVVSRVAWYAYSNADFAIVGRRFGSQTLGDYSLAFTLVSLPIEKLATLLFAVAPSVLTKLRHDATELKRYVLLLFEMLAFIVLPISIGLSLTISELVTVVLGGKWERTIPLVQIMSVFAVFKSFAPLSAAVLVSIGETAEPRRQALVGLAVMPVAFLVGSYYGVVGVALAWSSVFPILTVLQLNRALGLLNIHTGDVLRTTWPALFASAVMASSVIATRILASSFGGSVQIRLVLLLAVGAGTYSICMWLVANRRIRVLLSQLRTRGAR